MSVPATSTPSPSPSQPSPAELVAKLTSTPVNPKTLAVVTTLAFGNEAMKLAISQSPLVHMMFAFTETNKGDPSIVVSFAKALRSCVVNCPASRKLCNQFDVPSLLLSALKSHNKDEAEPTLTTEVITTLCAVCMNDEINGEKLKVALGSDTNLEGFCEGRADAEDLLKKCAFLRALIT
mmetsp:Transcript_21449/g.44683  ORF Transcript_21449/g.44683 Transcript_21449/m.44683 type:complete len:179 (+) Transcript_21449:75-611(+)